ncbi:Protein of unknown function, partial [Gryllus bimaculatus]
MGDLVSRSMRNMAHFLYDSFVSDMFIPVILWMWECGNLVWIVTASALFLITAYFITSTAPESPATASTATASSSSITTTTTTSNHMEGGETTAAPEPGAANAVNFIVGDAEGNVAEEDADTEAGARLDAAEEATDVFPEFGSAASTGGRTPSREGSASNNLYNMFALAEKRKRLRVF